MDETLNVLVVDDDEVDRMAVRRALTSAGLKIELSEAGDSATAIAAIASTAFDCVFLDYRLPDQDGLSLVQELRSTGNKIPVVILTGQGDEQVAVEMMKAGASDYLPKSRLSPDTLARILRNAVRLYQAEQQAALANQQREQLSRQREDFVSRLTHDLRTPLVAADRMLKLFQQEAFGPTSAEMNGAIAVMIRSNQNLLQMVNTLLEVYRHDAGEKRMLFDPCNMLEIVREVVEELLPLAQEKGLVLDLIDETDLTLSTSVVVMGDCLELRRLLTNLIGNAIKFTDAGSVTVRVGDRVTSANGTTASQVISSVIQVTDTGPGIAAEDQPSLFERYRQGNHKRSGSGLGLYLSRRIVEAHQGTIVAESTAGQGSTFTVVLPTRQMT